jgi:hypothetical protein
VSLVSVLVEDDGEHVVIIFGLACGDAPHGISLRCISSIHRADMFIVLRQDWLSGLLGESGPSTWENGPYPGAVQQAPPVLALARQRGILLEA